MEKTRKKERKNSYNKARVAQVYSLAAIPLLFVFVFSYNRTGSRTPMQWNDKKNHGFSQSDTPYLPTDKRENAPTVERQEMDEESLLLFVKKLIEIHKDNSALWADSDFRVIRAGYPFVFERYDSAKKVYVAINPSKYGYSCEMPRYFNILMEQNVEIEGDRAVLNGISLIVAEVINK